MANDQRRTLLKEYVRLILVLESRVDDVRKAFPRIEAFDALVQGQPAGSDNKYLMWCAKHVNDGSDPQKVLDLVARFHKNTQRLQKRDINQYQTTQELEGALERLGDTSKNQQRKNVQKNSTTIYDDGRYVIVRPHEHDAVKKYGMGTKWCITSDPEECDDEDSETDVVNHWKSYSGQNVRFYFIIDKDSTDSQWSKVAICLLDNGQFDAYLADDEQVELEDIRDYYGPIFTKMFDAINRYDQSDNTSTEVKKQLRNIADYVEGKPVKNSDLDDIVMYYTGHIPDEFFNRIFTQPPKGATSTMMGRAAAKAVISPSAKIRRLALNRINGFDSFTNHMRGSMKDHIKFDGLRKMKPEIRDQIVSDLLADKFTRVNMCEFILKYTNTNKGDWIDESLVEKTIQIVVDSGIFGNIFEDHDLQPHLIDAFLSYDDRLVNHLVYKMILTGYKYASTKPSPEQYIKAMEGYAKQPHWLAEIYSRHSDKWPPEVKDFAWEILKKADRLPAFR